MRLKTSPARDGMVVNQTAYIPNWAVCPSEHQPEVTVEELNAAKSKRLTLNKKALLFGRVEQVCDVLVSHVSASRVHACLAFDTDGKLHVADLGSTHGTDSVELVVYTTAAIANASCGHHLPVTLLRYSPCECC